MSENDNCIDLIYLESQREHTGRYRTRLESMRRYIVDFCLDSGAGERAADALAEAEKAMARLHMIYAEQMIRGEGI